MHTQWYRLLAYLMEMLDGVGVHVKDLKLQKSINGLVSSKGNVPKL